MPPRTTASFTYTEYKKIISLKRTIYSAALPF